MLSGAMKAGPCCTARQNGRMAIPVLVSVDNRLRFPEGAPSGFIKRMKQITSHANPEHARKRSLGLWTGAIPTQIRTWREDEGGEHFSLPRGVTGRMREVAVEFGLRLRWKDNRTQAPVEWGPFLAEPRDYQETGIRACMEFEQGIVRAPTGSGKTLMALAVLPRLGQRSLVIVRDRNLLDQWLDRAQNNLGLHRDEIGVVQGGKRTIGKRLTLALQQTLYSKKFPLDDFSQKFGAVVVDEVHDTAAKTVGETVDVFPARARLGFSADHTRRDRKEFLIEDLFGDVIFEVGKKHLEDKGAVVPVVLRLVPTDFEANWYAKAPPEERDFTKLVTEMVEDEERCKLVRQVVHELVKSNAVPALVFTHRREHAARLAELELPADGIPTGLLLGSAGNAEQFEESKSLLLSGVLKVAVGTFKAVGQGIDIPNVMAGVCATPIGANRQFFNQVRGRICRVVPGKKVGHLYYLWDRLVFPEAAKNLCNWNDGRVEVYDSRSKGWVSFR
jgi:superfamily II DNA or RNA helicase